MNFLAPPCLSMEHLLVNSLLLSLNSESGAELFEKFCHSQTTIQQKPVQNLTERNSRRLNLSDMGVGGGMTFVYCEAKKWLWVLFEHKSFPFWCAPKLMPEMKMGVVVRSPRQNPRSDIDYSLSRPR